MKLKPQGCDFHVSEIHMNRDKSTIHSFIMLSFHFCVQGPRYEGILTLYEVTSVSFSYLITSFLSLQG